MHLFPSRTLWGLQRCKKRQNHGDWEGSAILLNFAQSTVSEATAFFFLHCIALQHLKPAQVMGWMGLWRKDNDWTIKCNKLHKKLETSILLSRPTTTQPAWCQTYSPMFLKALLQCVKACQINCFLGFFKGGIVTFCCFEFLFRLPYRHNLPRQYLTFPCLALVNIFILIKRQQSCLTDIDCSSKED